MWEGCPGDVRPSRDVVAALERRTQGKCTIIPCKVSPNCLQWQFFLFPKLAGWRPRTMTRIDELAKRIAELEELAEQEGLRLPKPAGCIALYERAGKVVDLRTGAINGPALVSTAQGVQP